MTFNDLLDSGKQLKVSEANLTQAARQAATAAEDGTRARERNDQDIASVLANLPNGATSYGRTEADGTIQVYRVDPTNPAGYRVETPYSQDFEIQPVA